MPSPPRCALRSPLIGLCLALSACPAADDASPDDPDTDTDADTRDTDDRPDTDPDTDGSSDSDTDPPAETSDSARDTAGSGPTADTAPPPRLPPASWGGGFVDISDPIRVDHPFAVDAGSLLAGRPPQDTITLIADLDQDGDLELYVSPVPEDRPDDRPARVFHWNQGTLSWAPALSASLGEGWSSPVAALDLDGDGYTDLIQNDWREGIRWGRSTGFGPSQSLAQLDNDPRWGGTSGFGVYDVDRDGWLDIIHGSQSCPGYNEVLYQQAPRVFGVEPQGRPDAPSAQTDGLASARLADGRSMHVLVGFGCDAGDPHPGFVVSTRSPFQPLPVFDVLDATPPTAAWRLQPAFAGQPYTAIAPMGAGFDDLDGDGFLDLVVTLGIAEQGLFAGNGDGTFRDHTRDIVVDGASTGTPEFPWSVAFPDVDQDGRPDVLWTVGDDQTSFMVDQGHLLRNSLYWNDGAWGFHDVSDAVGLGALGNFRSMAVHDPDGDGDADLAMGGFGDLPRIYRNDVDVGHGGISLRLRGTSSNPLGIGARVLARTAGLPERTAAMGSLGNLFGRSEPILFLGAGSSPVIDELEIHWPSGLVQRLEDVPVGQSLTVEEPATLTVLDDDRRAPADGVSTIGVLVEPRLADGSPDPGASVTITVRGGGASLVAPPVHDGAGAWTAEVRAPSLGGRSWLHVEIDGRTVEVFPRLVWE